MEIYITLKKYNTHQRREEGKLQLMVYCLITILLSLTILTIVFMSNLTYPLMFIDTVYNNHVPG